MLENYLYSIKNQVNDKEQLGGKISDEDKEKVLDTVKEKLDWLTKNAETAAKEDFEEQKAEVEAVVNPITAKLYGSGGPGGAGGSGATGSDDSDHDEL